MKQFVSKILKLPIEELLFYLFLFSIPIQLKYVLNPESAYIGSYFSYHSAFIIFLSDLTFIALLLAWLYTTKGRLLDNKHTFWAILPVIWAILAWFHVEQSSLWLYGCLKILEFWQIIGFIKVHPFTVKPGIYILAIWGLVMSGIGIGQFYLQSGIGLPWLGEFVPHFLEPGATTMNIGSEKILRAYGTFPHPNVYGGFLAICLVLWLYVSRETKTYITTVLVSCGTILYLWGILVSFSRSGWLAASIVLILHFAWLIYSKKHKLAVYWLMLLIVSCGTLVLTNKHYVFPRATDIAETSQAVTYRNLYNQKGLEIFSKNWLAGIGPNQYIHESQKTTTIAWQNQPPHNIFLLYATELGIIGLIIAFTTIIKFGFTWNNWSWLNVSLVSSILVLGLLDHYLITIQQTAFLFALILGILITNKKDVSQVRETS